MSSFALLSIMFSVTELEGVESLVYFLIGVFLIIIQIIFLFFLFKKQKKIKETQKLQLLYKYLEKNNNNVSVIDFAKFSGLDPEEARKIIENLSIKLGAIPEIDDEGKVFYKF